VHHQFNYHEYWFITELLYKNPSESQDTYINKINMTSTDDDVVSISYTDLVAACSDNKSNINNLIERSFSSSGLGIIAITDVPNLPEMRLKLLPLAHKLASCTPDQLEKVTIAASGYQVGWSHGRERLEGNKYDYSKGSFYANPLTEDLAQSMLDRRKEDGDSEALKWDESLVKTEEEVRALAKTCPAFFAPNIWPTEDIPELESAFKDVAQLVHQVGIMLAKCCDSFVSANVSILLSAVIDMIATIYYSHLHLS